MFRRMGRANPFIVQCDATLWSPPEISSPCGLSPHPTCRRSLAEAGLCFFRGNFLGGGRRPNVGEAGLIDGTERQHLLPRLDILQLDRLPAVAAGRQPPAIG
jgi:hypothetical protein